MAESWASKSYFWFLSLQHKPVRMTWKQLTSPVWEHAGNEVAELQEVQVLSFLGGESYFYFPPKAQQQVMDAKQPGVLDWGVLTSEATMPAKKGAWELSVKYKHTVHAWVTNGPFLTLSNSPSWTQRHFKNEEVSGVCLMLFKFMKDPQNRIRGSHFKGPNTSKKQDLDLG